MNTAAQVAAMVNSWQGQFPKDEIVVKVAEACLGWSYVWGGYGQYCTAANRRAYAARTSLPAGEGDQIKKKCQQLNGKKTTCEGCKYYPGGQTRFFDCRGFTGWCLQQVGFKLIGAGATSQWNTSSNWYAKGEISKMPSNQLCCVFMHKNGKMIHTGLHVGGGVIIHCSGEVKYAKSTDKGWTHFAVPRGFENGDIPLPIWRPTVRRGSSGENVKYVQEKLIELGYDLSPYGADGKFGAKTEDAVRMFQSEHKLKADGIVGPMTYDALDSAAPRETEPLYTITIPHITKEVADALAKQYAGASIILEEGDG